MAMYAESRTLVRGTKHLMSGWFCFKIGQKCHFPVLSSLVPIKGRSILSPVLSFCYLKSKISQDIRYLLNIFNHKFNKKKLLTSGASIVVRVVNIDISSSF